MSRTPREPKSTRGCCPGSSRIGEHGSARTCRCSSCSCRSSGRRSPRRPRRTGHVSAKRSGGACQKDAHAGLAVTIDVGDRHELHPTNKQAVGARLARAARHVVYGEAVTPSGPVAASATRAAAGVDVTFADVDGALVTYSARQPIGFEVCGDTQASCRFAPAALEGSRVTIAVPGSRAGDARPVLLGRRTNLQPVRRRRPAGGALRTRGPLKGDGGCASSSFVVRSS